MTKDPRPDLIEGMARAIRDAYEGAAFPNLSAPLTDAEDWFGEARAAIDAHSQHLHDQGLVIVGGEAADKIEGLQADLDEAVRVAYRRGALDWVRLNYPKQYERLQAAAYEGEG